ncbi:MAG: DUF1190 domain-containing protein [Gammaproteobacteria bacterium]|nr:DUF1190 domain-containing protein [Gammaproteobacteria bacterium]
MESTKPKPLPLAIAVAIAAAHLSGCSEERIDAGLYESIEGCVADLNERKYCEDAFADAKAQHAEVAPQFANLADCEAEFGAGKCGSGEQTGSSEAGGGYFFPFFMGYMLARTMTPGLGAQPVYKSGKGAWKTPGGTVAGLSTGATSVAKNSMTPARSRTKVTSRGGFSSTRAGSGG